MAGNKGRVDYSGELANIEMISVLAVLSFAFIQCDVDAIVLKRQIPGIDSACVVAVSSLSSKELQCLYGSSEGSGYHYYDDDAGTDDHYDSAPSNNYANDYGSGFISGLSFAHLCTDSFCSNVITNKVIPKCRVSIYSYCVNSYSCLAVAYAC